MVQARIRQRRQLVARQHDRRGDQVGIQADLGCAGHQRDQILAHRRLAAREVDLEHADLGQFVDHAQPFRRRQFL